VVDLARRGLGIAVLSTSMTAGLDDELARVRITGVNVAAVLALVWKQAGANPAREALLQQCAIAFGMQDERGGSSSGSAPRRPRRSA
jgi:DNA-binding transcriptional LysR family regulator